MKNTQKNQLSNTYDIVVKTISFLICMFIFSISLVFIFLPMETFANIFNINELFLTIKPIRFSFILLICFISIVLAAFLALVTIYYGGDVSKYNQTDPSNSTH